MYTPTLERPVLAVDVAIFRVLDAQLQVLLYQRCEEPFKDALSLPGVAIRVDETLENAAKRALAEKIGWPLAAQRDVYLDQLATFDALYRDPRGRTISTAYLGIIRTLPTNSPAMIWQPVADLASGILPFDHALVIDAAVQRLRGKLRYTNIARGFLPETFRIEKLQEVYEAILGHPVNRTNFRIKLLRIKLIVQVRILNEAIGKRGGRPPHLYRFTQELLAIVDRDFL